MATVPSDIPIEQLLPFVSVIVPVWNGADCVARCVEAIQAQTYPSDRFTLFVVDNGSTDDTVAIVRRYPNVTVLEEPVASSYRARNLALQHATGDYALFTDADCVPDPDWIAAAVRAAKVNPDAGVLGGRITLFEAGPCDPGCKVLECMFTFNQERTATLGYFVTANWMSPLTLLKELGGFNATLRSGGDLEMSGRVRASGRPIVYVPDMIVGHPVRGSYAEVQGKYLRTLGGRWKLRDNDPLRLLRSLAGQVKGVVDRMVRAWTTPGFGFADRMRVTVLLARLFLGGLVETGRLMAGGEPRRA